LLALRNIRNCVAAIRRRRILVTWLAFIVHQELAPDAEGSKHGNPTERKAARNLLLAGRSWRPGLGGEIAEYMGEKGHALPSVDGKL
jgi:hypothetical protein